MGDLWWLRHTGRLQSQSIGATQPVIHLMSSSKASEWLAKDRWPVELAIAFRSESGHNHRAFPTE